MSLPNFICLGAAKSGTTTLYDILSQHPEIYTPSFKEPHFFDIVENFENGLAWYEKTYFDKSDSKIVADFTPSYFFDKHAPKRIFDSLGPKLKFLVVIRHPVDRAYSHYLHSKRDFHEEEIFEKSLELESDRLRYYEKKSDYLFYLRHSYIHQGLYSKMLERYLRFFSLENFLFIHFEDDFLKERDLTIRKILDFLEIDNSVALNTDIRSNPASKAKSKWIKKLTNKKTWWRDVIKLMVPNVKLRQIIRNRIQRFNIIEYTPEPLSQVLKSELLEVYFREDISNLERILDKKMNW